MIPPPSSHHIWESISELNHHKTHNVLQNTVSSVHVKFCDELYTLGVQQPCPNRLHTPQ